MHVAGAVRHPGVFRLAAGRVGDAVRKAGGPRKDADLNAINLAAKIADGQQVVVPTKATVVPPGAPALENSGTATASGAKISLNTATKEELDTLEGVGPATADKILEYRKEHGGFGSVDDLKDITGIGDKKFEALKDSVQP